MRSDKRIVTVEGVSRNNINNAVKSLAIIFPHYHLVGLSEEYYELIKALRLYIEGMKFKHSNCTETLLRIFNVYLESKRSKLDRIRQKYIITNRYSPLTILTLSYINIITDEIAKFHNAPKILENISEIHNHINGEEEASGLPPIHLLLVFNFYREIATFPVKRGENNRVTKYTVDLKKLYIDHMRNDQSIHTKVVELRTREIVNTSIDMTVFDKEILRNPIINKIMKEGS